jgi:hypothetical protein
MINIVFAILARDRHHHSPLIVIAQRLPAPSPSVVLDRVTAALVSASSGRNPQGRDSFSWLGERSE